jgi:hypothetical protein
MNSVLISLLVTAVFFVVAIILGFRLGRSSKPYPKLLLSAHAVMFFAIAYGIGACLDKLKGVTTGTSLAKVALFVALGLLWANLVSGIVMICLKKKNRGWILAHKLTMFSIAISLVVAGIFMAMKW